MFYRHPTVFQTYTKVKVKIRISNLGQNLKFFYLSHFCFNLATSSVTLWASRQITISVFKLTLVSNFKSSNYKLGEKRTACIPR